MFSMSIQCPKRKKEDGEKGSKRAEVFLFDQHSSRRKGRVKTGKREDKNEGGWRKRLKKQGSLFYTLSDLNAVGEVWWLPGGATCVASSTGSECTIITCRILA